MKKFILLFVSFGFLSISIAQNKDFYPEIQKSPDISDKGVAEFEKNKKEYERLLQEGPAYKEMTEEQRSIIDDELYYDLGAFSTDIPGCSWYCATGPKEFKTSSTLPAGKTSNYKAENLHDFKLKTAWVEGKEDYGIGEEIEVSFDFGKMSQLRITSLIIFNGYCKSESTWKANSRVKTFAISVNGTDMGKLHLKDTYLGQRFDIGNFADKVNIKLKILEVYPGSKYKDTAISEINFDGTGDH
ncbi:MAG: hypothetical protein MRZ79_12700 [Bacteroidia bacterium]|nr:hypothetical protein [Bacteroidia bacterium]